MLLALALLLQAAAAPDAAVALAGLGPVPRDEVRLVLVRHGQALSNLDPEPELPPDQLDRLTDLGRAQARLAARALARSGVALVVTSPAGRARETAEEMRAVLGAPAARVDARLRPLELGRGEGGEALAWDARVAEWKAGRDPSPPGGESLEQAGRRVLGLAQALRAEVPGRMVVLVTHGEVIAAAIGAIEGIPGARRYPPTAKNGSLTVVDAGPRAAVRLSNLVPAP